MKSRKNKAFFAAPLVIVFMCGILLTGLAGCFQSALKKISFKSSRIDMSVGDVLDVTSSALTFEPELASNKNFTVHSSDENVVSCDVRTLTAVGPGTATVTAVADSNPDVKAECTVLVDYAEAKSLTLSLNGSRVQYIGSVQSVAFTAIPDVQTSPEWEFLWTVNGEKQEEKSNVFIFTPDEKAAGSYKISAQLNSIIASDTVKVFTAPPKNVYASYSGALEQKDDYTPVNVKVNYDKTEGDPEPFFDWYVNGELYLTGSGSLSFTPVSAGFYDISVKLNGESVLIDGKEKLTVTAKGSVIPANVTVNYNNVYPDIIVEWNYPHNENMKYQLKVENLTSGETDETLTGTNVSAAPYFDGASFNAGAVLNIAQNSYRISVRSLGDGATYGVSEYSKPVTVEKIDASSIQFLNNKVLGDSLDHYIVSDKEFLELYSYYLAYRKNTAKVAYTVYMGYTSTMSRDELLEEAFQYGATTGSYFNTGSGGTTKGSKLNVSVTCKNSVIPTLSGGNSYDQLNALEPHVAKDSSRTASHVFPIDLRTAPAQAETSEELFRAVELGAKPVPVKGSTAERLYNFARGLLLEIVSDDMTDAEKVHAIYDWIMWNVQYDYKATGESDAGKSGAYKAYYLDGVLTNIDSYAVCDGMAKTLSLLCNMEGIPAYRVTGTAGDSVAGMTTAEAKRFKKENWGGHAWNKVYVDGQWYAVDPTWGDSSGRMGNKTYEMAFHQFLLVSDDYILDTHEYDVAVNNPDTADDSYNVYDNFEYEFVNKAGKTVTVDTYIDTLGSSMFSEAADMAEYLHYLKQGASKSITIYNKTLTRTYIGLEITAPDNLMSSFLMAASQSSVDKNPFKSALAALGYSSLDYRVSVWSDRVVLMLYL